MGRVHLILYSEGLGSASFRATADPATACLTIDDVPPGVSSATVARLANETAIAQPAGRHDTISFAKLGANTLVNLYA